MTEPEARKLAEHALDLARKHDADNRKHDAAMSTTLAPIVAAVGGDEATARAVSAGRLRTPRTAQPWPCSRPPPRPRRIYYQSR